MRVITSVEGKVPENKTKIFEESYAKIKDTELPSGLISSSLVKSKNGDKYKIMTFWDSYESIEKMRAVGKPKALELFENIGITPTIEIYEEIDKIG